MRSIIHGSLQADLENGIWRQDPTRYWSSVNQNLWNENGNYLKSGVLEKILVHNGDLFASAYNGIYKYGESGWELLFDQTRITAFESHNGQLFAGFSQGTFIKRGGSPCEKIEDIPNTNTQNAAFSGSDA